MAYLQEQMEILKFDKRLLEINLKNGTITKEQYQQFLSALADVEGQSEKLNLDDSSSTESAEPNGIDPATSPTNTDPLY